MALWWGRGWVGLNLKYSLWAWSGQWAVSPAPRFGAAPPRHGCRAGLGAVPGTTSIWPFFLHIHVFHSECGFRGPHGRREEALA